VADPQPVLVVTDSTSDIPAHFRDELGITVVPLTIAFGTRTFRDGIDLSPARFLDMLQNEPALPTTSQPPVTDFEEVFRTALDRGQDVVCVTISSDLSGTFNSARLAAEAVDPARITVVDSRSTTMQLGWIAIHAARQAREGADAATVAAAARDAIGQVKLFAVLRTLDYVYKGGRIGKAQQLVGSALAIKPILGVVDGVVVPVERVRLWKRAVARATELVTPTPTDIIVLHSENLEDANQVAADLARAYPDARIEIDYAGATITTYAGPGAIGVAALYVG